MRLQGMFQQSDAYPALRHPDSGWSKELEFMGQAKAAAEQIYNTAVIEHWPGTQRPLFSVTPDGRYYAVMGMSRGEIVVRSIIADAARRLWPTTDEVAHKLANEPDFRTWFGSLMAGQR